ncbi:hypothetical protein Ct61P_05900 [Colletotrichum tofieldiae]|nr:hypothetical protein Ct61P_05900 [Colletotrichum tofieldiae]
MLYSEGTLTVQHIQSKAGRNGYTLCGTRWAAWRLVSPYLACVTPVGVDERMGAGAMDVSLGSMAVWAGPSVAVNGRALPAAPALPCACPVNGRARIEQIWGLDGVGDERDEAWAALATLALAHDTHPGRLTGWRRRRRLAGWCLAETWVAARGGSVAACMNPRYATVGSTL